MSLITQEQWNQLFSRLKVFKYCREFDFSQTNSVNSENYKCYVLDPTFLWLTQRPTFPCNITNTEHLWEYFSLTGWPRSLSLLFRDRIFWSWSANSTKRSSCSFLESVTSTSNLSFSVCRMAMVLLDESSCFLMAVFSSDRALISF